MGGWRECARLIRSSSSEPSWPVPGCQQGEEVVRVTGRQETWVTAALSFFKLNS